MRVGVAHFAEDLESLENISVAEAPIRGNHGTVTMQARTGLWSFRNASGYFLIRKHVGMTATITVVQGKTVSGNTPLQPGIALELLSRQRLGPAVSRPRDVNRALIAGMLTRPVHSPRRGVGGVLGDFDEANVRILCFL